MYYDLARANEKVMLASKDLFPIECECQNCRNTFYFTELDDFGIYDYEFGYKKYRTLDWFCPFCKSERYWQMHPGADKNNPEWVRTVLPLVVAYRSTKKRSEIPLRHILNYVFSATIVIQFLIIMLLWFN